MSLQLYGADFSVRWFSQIASRGKGVEGGVGRLVELIFGPCRSEMIPKPLHYKMVS